MVWDIIDLYPPIEIFTCSFERQLVGTRSYILILANASINADLEWPQFPPTRTQWTYPIITPNQYLWDFDPSLFTTSLHRYGISKVSDFLHGDSPYTLVEIEQKYSIPEQQRFTCFRMFHLLSKYPTPKLNLHSKAWSFFNEPKHNIRGFLSYFILQDKHTFSKFRAISLWENDLHTPLSPSQWQTALRLFLKATHCTNHIELTLKITNRWYYTQKRLARSPSLFPLCWHDFGHIGNLIQYMFSGDALISPASGDKYFSCWPNALGFLLTPTLPWPCWTLGEIYTHLCTNTCYPYTTRNSFSGATKLEIKLGS